jgi:outer membrane protein OmpA-like peptidoglycan-associated protein
MAHLTLKSRLGLGLSTLLLCACTPSSYPPPATGVVPQHPAFNTDNASSDKLTPTTFLQRNGINVVTIGDIVEIIIPADKIFLANSTEVKYSGEPFLFAVAALIRSYDTPPINITGHTDLIGTAPHKTDLSKLWAQSVATYLWAHGIPLDHIHMDGAADTQNVANRNTSHGAYYNRRVEVSFWRQRVKNVKRIPG